MHELGVTFYIIRDAKEAAEQNDANKITSVTLQLGEVSGVIFEYLEDCWNWAVKKEALMEGCRLIHEQIPAITYCEACGRKYPTVQYGKICPHCGSEHTYLVQGNEVRIKEIEVI